MGAMHRSLGRTLVSASFMLALLAGGAPAYAEDAPGKAPLTEEQQAEAKAQFAAGVNLLDDPDGAKYEEAYRAFRRAYELTGSAKVLGNIAFCAFHLERDGEAIDAYTTYLREVPDISDRERAQIQRDLTTMTATVGRAKIIVRAEGKAYTLIDKRSQTRGAPIENAYPFQGTEFSVRVRPGRHSFIVKSSDGESMPVDATIEPGGSGTYEFSMTRPPTSVIAEQPSERPKETRSNAGPIVLGALGLAGIATGVVTGLIAKGKESDIQAQCPDNVCPATYTGFVDDRSSAKTFGTIADIGYIGGGALLAGAVVWYLLKPSSSGPSAKSGANTTAWLPSAGCTGSGCGLHLQGGF